MSDTAKPAFYGFKITIDGESVTVNPRDVTAKQATAVRLATGHSVRAAMQALDSDPDIDLIAALFWLGRMQDGAKVTFDSVASGISYGSSVEVDVLTEDVEAGDPEA